MTSPLVVSPSQIFTSSISDHSSSHSTLNLRVAMSAPAPTQKGPQGADLIARFAFAGAVCCSVTHGAFTPVDV